MEIQRLNVSTKDKFDRVQKYFQILSVLNNLGLSKGDISLLTFTLVKGNISDTHIKDEYCKEYNTTRATINNIVDRLKKKNILHKKDKKIFVNPVLSKLSFDDSFSLVIVINKDTP